MVPLGARQTGKTTLANSIAQNQKFHYLDLEAPQDLLKLSDPIVYLESRRNKLAEFDEIRFGSELVYCVGWSYR